MHRLVLPALILLGGPAAHASDAERLDLRRDPAKSGAVLTGVDDGRFDWSAPEGLSALFDSTLPSSRLALPLGRSLTGADSFALEVELELLAIEGGPDDFMQLAFGLINSATTGLNRTGTTAPPPIFFIDDSDTYDQIELGYFPNVTFFGGPTLQPAVFGEQVGSPFDNFAANFGPSADLGDNTADQLREWPLGRRVRVLLVHDACAQLLSTRLFDAKSGEELDAGLEPVDLRFLNAIGTFEVDSFAISLYRDHADPDPGTRSLFAHARFHSASLEVAETARASWSPRALNPDAQSEALLRVEGGAAPWLSIDSGELGSSGGDLLSIELDRQGRGYSARLPRGLVLEGPWELEVGGCLLEVEGPDRLSGR